MCSENNLITHDKWSGWKIENNQIDYSIRDIEYLNDRRKYLLKHVINNESSKILDEIGSYSNRQVLAWGCGSGKTTKLKFFCAYTNEPTIIVVKTNEEIQRIVFDVKALNFDQSIAGLYSGSDELNELSNDTDYLMNFKIIVTNSWRSLSDYEL